jgi:tetratricopeptide (TPR) repeat protein
MKKIIPVLLFTVQFSFAMSQTTETDSLKKRLSVTTEDTSRVMMLEDLSYAYGFSYPDSALQYALEGLHLAQNIKFLKGEAYCINALGNVYFNAGNYPKSLQMYLRSLQIREKLDDPRTIAVVYSNIASVYSEQGDSRQALDYMSRTITIDRKIKDSVGLLIDFLNTGEMYYKIKQYDSALLYEQTALKIAEESHDENYIGAVLNNLGDIYTVKKDTAIALKYYREAIMFAIITNDQEEISKGNLGMAVIYKNYGKPDAGINYAQKALMAATEASFTKHILNAAQFLSELYKEKRNIDSAFKYQDLSMAMKDTLFNSEKIRQVQNLSFSEKLRQEEIAEENVKQQQQRRDLIQLTAIAVFIISLLTLVLILGRRHTKPRTVEFLGVIGLLLLFEFISYLIHPYIGKFSDHKPIFYLMGSVLLASVLAPMHHFTTRLVKEKLVKQTRAVPHGH